MSPELLNWLTSTGAFIVALLLGPNAAIIVGAFWGGYAIGANKNKTAIAEILRGVFAGFAAGAAVYVLQLIIRNGGAS